MHCRTVGSPPHAGGDSGLRLCQLFEVTPMQEWIMDYAYALLHVGLSPHAGRRFRVPSCIIVILFSVSARRLLRFTVNPKQAALEALIESQRLPRLASACGRVRGVLLQLGNSESKLSHLLLQGCEPVLGLKR